MCWDLTFCTLYNLTLTTTQFYYYPYVEEEAKI